MYEYSVLPSVHCLTSATFKQLGEWQLACNLPTAEDILSDFESYPITDEVERVLRPNLVVLTNLLHSPEDVDTRFSPVLGYLEKIKKPHDAEVWFAGTISIQDRARTMHWISKFVPGAKGLAVRWVGRAPLVHAFTLLLTGRRSPELETDPDVCNAKTEEEALSLALQKVWAEQVTQTSGELARVDVDQESISLFEKRIFEISKEAGPAGYSQWGLDAGHLENGWFPYGLVPEGWNDGTYEEDEEQLGVSDPSDIF